MKLYKLSHENKAEFDNILTPLVSETLPTKSTYTAQLLSGEAITVVNVGHVPIPAVMGEDGEVITEATFHEDWAVDVLTPIAIDELEAYCVVDFPENWSNEFVRTECEIVYPTPNSTWLKADIRAWLTTQGIEWDKSLTKAELLKLW